MLPQVAASVQAVLSKQLERAGMGAAEAGKVGLRVLSALRALALGSMIERKDSQDLQNAFRTFLLLYGK